MQKFCFFIFAIFFTSLQAQDDYVFEVNAPTQVSVGQPFDIQFIIRSSRGFEASDFKAPTFKGLDIHFGPSQSQSSSTSVINGKRSQTISLILYYRVSAPKEGMINFGPASIRVAGKTYKTKGVSLQVTKAQQQAHQTQRSGHGGQASRASANAPQPRQPASIGPNDVFIKATANKRSVYEGEEIILDYTLSTNVHISQYNIYKRPSSQGFWQEPVTINSKPVQNGRTVSLNLDKSLIYPQRSGKLTIDPLEIEVLAQIMNQRRSQDPFEDFFNGFFNSSVQQVTKNIRSNQITFDVKPLPESGKPESFKGNVGRFTFQSKIDKTTLKSNEALTITITIAGHGNLRHIEPPNVLFPADFEVYEPQEEEQINVNTTGMNGSKTFKFLAIPRTQGSYVIPPIKFSYFDPTKNKYVEYQTEEYKITVQKGDKRFETSTNSVSENEYLNRDIEFIKTRTSTLKAIDQKFLFSPLFCGIFALPFVLFLLFFILYRRLESRNADVVGLREKRALKEAKRNLRKAEKFMEENNKEAFYIEISQALWGFLSKKFNIPVAELSIDTGYQILAHKNIPIEHTEQFLKALNDCEFARFAPNGDAMQSMLEIYKEALDVIRALVLAMKTIKKDTEK